MHICRHLTLTLAVVALLSFLSSCGGDEEVHVAGEGHAHTGPHGGLVNSIGDFTSNSHLMMRAAQSRFTFWEEMNRSPLL